MDGWVVMVPFVIPGELVKVRIYRNHSHYSEADLLEIIEPSEYRVTLNVLCFQRVVVANTSILITKNN